MILVDSGPLIAAAIEDDRDHRRCVDMFASLRLNREKLLVPQTVVAEGFRHRHCRAAQRH